MFKVETGKGKGAYSVRYTFDNHNQAMYYYNCLNTHSGYKKRLTDPEGKVIARYIS